VLEGILAEEETHLGVIDQHNALLEASRESLSDEARDLLEALGHLDRSDYESCARHAVERVVPMMTSYGDSALRRKQIEAAAPSPG
jgi:hypothetical protein